MDTIKIENLKDPREREILELLKNRGGCPYGNIFEQLHFSTLEGRQIIYSMLSRGLIRYKKRSSIVELNVDLS